MSLSPLVTIQRALAPQHHADFLSKNHARIDRKFPHPILGWHAIGQLAVSIITTDEYRNVIRWSGVLAANHPLDVADELNAKWLPGGQPAVVATKSTELFRDGRGNLSIGWLLDPKDRGMVVERNFYINTLNTLNGIMPKPPFRWQLDFKPHVSLAAVHPHVTDRKGIIDEFEAGRPPMIQLEPPTAVVVLA